MWGRGAAGCAAAGEIHPEVVARIVRTIGTTSRAGLTESSLGSCSCVGSQCAGAFVGSERPALRRRQDLPTTSTFASVRARTTAPGRTAGGGGYSRRTGDDAGRWESRGPYGEPSPTPPGARMPTTFPAFCAHVASGAASTPASEVNRKRCLNRSSSSPPIRIPARSTPLADDCSALAPPAGGDSRRASCLRL